MPKYSVKRPFTVLVAVVLVLVLGFVSLMGMPTDLLPSISLPYLIVVTTYPGASPEKVESDLTKPLESALGTVNGVENVTSTSSENYSMVMLEFAEDTNMDSAMVKASTALNQLADTLPDMAGTPTLIEMSPDMMATQYVALDCDGMDIYQLSAYAEDTVIPALERVSGVASVSATGLVEKTVEVTLSQSKIDAVNDKLLVKVSDRLAEAKEKLQDSEGEINSGLSKLDTAQTQLNSGKQQLETQKTSLTQQLRDAITNLDAQIPVLEEKIGELGGKISDVQAKIDGFKVDTGSIQNVDLPEITFAIDDALLAQANTALATYLGADYNAAAMPTNLEDAKNNPQKMVAMGEGITAAQAVIKQKQADVMQVSADGVTDAAVTAALANLDGQIAAATAQTAALDAQISTLETDPDLANDPEKTAQLEQLRAARTASEATRTGLQQQRDALAALQSDAALLNTTGAALLNARQLVEARKAAEASANSTAQTLENSANATLSALRTELDSLNSQLSQATALLGQLNTQRAQLQSSLAGVEQNPLDTALADTATTILFSGMDAQLALGQFQLDSGKTQLESGKTQIESAWGEYNSAREEALKSANMDQLLNMKTLAQLIGAQNFSMPAGYIQDGDEKYLLKVGDQFEDVDALSGALLCSVDGIGDVRLSDVADIAVTDDAGESYAKVGANQAVLLAVYKGSTASTSDVSDACNAEMQTLMQNKDGLRLTALMDQGDYIRLIIGSVMSNLIWGAVLAIIVLALFLKDLRPTLVVAISIPLSVLFAIVLMYFTGVTLNMISLSGLALGIGMLVDNSIVVIENIYRLRARGVPAARAAVQGARQVSGAIISSTATTICVFLPLVFAEGITRELLSDMALTIGYSLVASLIVALTVVPCAGSTLLKKAADKKHPLFDRLTELYEKVLRLCLRVKAVPLGLAVVLLGVSMWQLAEMGLVLIPDMSSNQLSVTVQMPENETDAEYFATADQIMEQLVAVDGIETAGAMTSSGTASAFMGGSGGETNNSNISYYLILTTEGGRNQSAVKQEILDRTAGYDCEITVGSGSAVDMSALTGSGVQVDIYGNDLDTLLSLSAEVEDAMGQIPGITEISNGQEKGDAEVRVVVDKDKAMRLGLTVAQVYAELSGALTTDTTSTTLSAADGSYTVQIIDTTKTPELSDIFDYEFETTVTAEDGKQTTETHKLGEFASRQNAEGVASIARENQARMMSVTSSTADGYNTTQLSRQVRQALDEMDLPAGYTAQIGGETTQVSEMVLQMAKLMALALVLIYLVMVAQFQSLLSPFIVLFTIPLAFTGGALGLMAAGETLSLMSLMGFLVLMGVVVNNGIVFVDYTNQLRLGGLDRHTALVATGKTRMRPIFMTAMTTILAMVTMLFSRDAGSEMGRGMAIVIIGGLLYATLMTLFIVPVMYDILFRKKPTDVDIGEEGMDDLPDDAAEFAQKLEQQPTAQEGSAQ